MPGSLRLIRLTNIGSFEQFEASFLSVALLITGDNGTGKSTLHDSFMCMFDDHNEDLIRAGCSEGQIYIEAEVEGKIIKSLQTVRRGGSKYDIECDGQPIVKKQKEFLKGLVNGLSLNPMDFIAGDDKQRLEFLLKIWPITFYPNEVAEITPDVMVPDVGLDLPGFEAWLQRMELARTKANAAKDVTAKSLTKLEASVKPSDGINWGAKAKELREQKAAAESEYRNLSRNAEVVYREQVEALKEGLRNEIADLAKQQEDEIEAIRRKYEALRTETRNVVNAEIEQAEAVYFSALGDAQKPIQERISALAAELATAEANAEQSARDEALREHVRSARESFAEESKAASRAQDVVEGLRNLKKLKLSGLGIKGVTIEEGKIFVDGVKYSTQLNMAERIKVAFKIISRAAKKCPIPLMVADDAADLMNEDNIGWVMKAAKASNIQIMLTKRVRGQKDVRVIPYDEWAKEAA